MKFTKFFLQNFKGIKNLEIKLDKGKPLALVGLNESGKTSILEGIKLIGQHCKNIQEYHLENGELQKIKPKINFFSENIVLKAYLTNNKKEYELEFIYKFKGDKYIDYEKNFNSSLEEELHDLNFPDILYYDDFIFTVPSKIEFPINPEEYNSLIEDDSSANSLEKKINRQWIFIIQDIFASYKKEKKINDEISFHEAFITFLDNDNRNAFDNNLLDFSEHLNKKIVKQWNSIFKVNSLLKQIVFKCNNFEIGSQNRSFSLKVKSKDDKEYEISERSKGCMWFFSFVIFTEFRKYRNENTIFLLDEPAANLHASAQEKIMSNLNKLSRDCNVIYSTHSPYLIDIENLEDTRIVKNKNSNSETKPADIICSNIGNANDRDDLNTIYNYLDFKLPILFIKDKSKIKEIIDKLKHLKLNYYFEKLKDFLDNYETIKDILKIE